MSAQYVPSDAESEWEADQVEVLPDKGCCQFDCCTQIQKDRAIAPRLAEIKIALQQENDAERRLEYQYQLLCQWAGCQNTAQCRPEFAMTPGKHRRYQVLGCMVCRVAVAEFLLMGCKKVTSLVQWAEQGHLTAPFDLRRSEIKSNRKVQDPAVTSAYQMWRWVPCLTDFGRCSVFAYANS